MVISTVLSDQATDILNLLGQGLSYDEVVDRLNTITYHDIFDAAGEAFDCASARCHIDVYEALREWRAQEATRQEIPPYYIFSDRSLLRISECTPATRSELAACHGVGPAKLDKYGDDLLDVIESADAPDADHDDSLAPLTRSVLQWTADGHSIMQIVDTYPDLGETGVRAAYSDAAERLGRALPRSIVAATSMESLPEQTMAVLGFAVEPSPSRFAQPGWSYQGFADGIACPECGGSLHIFRKPYESAGKQYRYWGIVCTSEKVAREMRGMETTTKASLRKWSEQQG